MSRTDLSKAAEPARPAVDDEEETKRLIAEFKGGNQHAFTELVRRYHNQIVSLAYKVTGDYDEAADVAQNVFVKMARNIWRYDETKKFYTWLYRITLNASIDHMRKHQRHRHESLDSFPHVAENYRTSPEFGYQRRQLKEHIESAADLLTDKQRSAFWLRDVEGCKVDDVASVMNMPEATVRWYLHRARQRIRKELTRKCPQLLLLMGIK
ncbi:MAG: RNA polymerase sigma factor [candidate division Zixibacteria bacterium]|nr:RNA polymerase sigma factor [candidate division Zixibacteria bacterium]